MVGHQAEGVDGPVEAAADLAKEVEERFPVVIA
jgi:hypothetical protein